MRRSARAVGGAPRSGWRTVRAPQRVGAALAQRHRLRLHGWCLGSLALAAMWATAHTLMLAGVHALALRYLLTLGAGYLAYLLALRLWAGWLVRRHGRGEAGDGGWAVDAPAGSTSGGPPGGPSPGAWRSGGGGDFAGGGASGDWEADAADTTGQGASALDVAGSLDEGAVVVVPVVAIFVLGAALLGGAGALAWLYFGSEVLLAVAVELAFSVAAARAAMGVERAGWLRAAVRLTWKPLLAALLCAVVLGGALQAFVPQAQSLPHAVRLLRGA